MIFYNTTVVSVERIDDLTVDSRYCQYDVL